jgi:hypothetical protein
LSLEWSYLMSTARTAFSTKKEINDFKKAAKKFSDGATTSRQKARDALVDLGIYTKTGKLTSAYGGGHKKKK